METEIIKIINGLLSAELRRLQIAKDVSDCVPESQTDAELYDLVLDAMRWVHQSVEMRYVLEKEGLLVINGKLFLRKETPIAVYGNKTERIV